MKRFAALLLALLFSVSGCTGITESQLLAPEKEEQLPESEPLETPPDEGPAETAPADEPAPPAESAVRLYLPETAAKEVSFPDDGAVYVAYAVNDERAGKVRGADPHPVTENKRVEALPELGYRFVRWSDGSTDPVRMDTADTVSENTVFTAVFDYAVLDMPIVAIDTETGRDVTSKTEFIGASFRLCAAEDPREEFESEIEIRGRGNNAWGYSKKPYKLRFPVKVNPLGIAEKKDKVWVLLANVSDQSMLRNKVCYDLSRGLDGIAFAPASCSVEVYLNGEYHGVYLLAEEIRDSEARVVIDTTACETDTDIGYLVEMSSYANVDRFTAASRPYMVHSDLSSDAKIKKKQMEFIADFIEECYAVLKTGERAEIEKLMDLDSLVDTYLVEEFGKNFDTGHDSCYLYKEKGGKLFFGPIWDFDLTLGNADLPGDAASFEGLFTALTLGADGGNPWYYTPMKFEWFRKMVADRWNEVRETVFKTMPEDVRKEGAARNRSYSRNFDRWAILGTRQHSEPKTIQRFRSYKQHYEYLAEWSENRYAWLDEMFNTPEFLTMKLSLGGTADEADYADDLSKAAFAEKKDFVTAVRITDVDYDKEGYNNENGENLFDGVVNSKYCFPCEGTCEIEFTFGEAVSPSQYAFQTANDTASYSERNAKHWKIFGSNDGKTWDELARVDDGRTRLKAVNFTWFVFDFDRTGTYTHYKIQFRNDNQIVQFGGFALLG